MADIVSRLRREAAVLFVLWFVASGLILLRPSPCGFLGSGERCLVTENGYDQPGRERTLAERQAAAEGIRRIG